MIDTAGGGGQGGTESERKGTARHKRSSHTKYIKKPIIENIAEKARHKRTQQKLQSLELKPIPSLPPDSNIFVPPYQPSIPTSAAGLSFSHVE